MVVIKEVVIMGQMMVMVMIVEKVKIVVVEVVEKIMVMLRMPTLIKKNDVFYQHILPKNSTSWWL